MREPDDRSKGSANGILDDPNGIVHRAPSPGRTEERRRGERYRVRGTVRLSSEEVATAPRISARLLDLSGGGALVEAHGAPTPLAKGPLLLHLELPGLDPLAFRARTVRSVPAPERRPTHRLGLRFHHAGHEALGSLAAFLSGVTRRSTPFECWDDLWRHERRNLLEVPVDALARIALRGDGRVFRVAVRPGETDIPPALLVRAVGGDENPRFLARPPSGWRRPPERDAPRILVWAGRRSLIVVRAVLNGDDWPAPLLPLQAAFLRRRRHDRVPMARGMLWARFEHPLLPGRRIVRPVLDVGEAGLCLEGDARTDALPPGLALSDLRIVLPDGAEVSLDGTIRAVRTGRGGGADRFGIELRPQRRQEAWDRFVLRQLLPDADLLRPDEVEQIWDLFDRTGYLREKDPAQLARCREPFQRTWRTLAHAPGLGAGVVVRDRSVLRGAMFYTRAWPGTYLLHHLALDLHATAGALTAPQVAGEVYRYLYHACRRMPDLRHAVGLFNARSRWWNHLFDDFHALGPPAEWYAVDRLRLVEAPVSDAAGAAAGGSVSVGRLEDHERPAVEQAVRRVVPPLAAAALALDPLDPVLADLQRDFAEVGLLRRREVWVARREERILGAAIADTASPGTNLFGLLDAVQLLPAEDAALEPHWAGAVLAAVAGRRAADGAETLTVLCPADVPDVSLPPAFVELATLRRWTAARELLPLYLTYLDEHFDARRALDGEEPLP